MIKLSHTGTNVRSPCRCLMISLSMDAVWSVISTGGSPASIGCAVDPTEHDPSRLLFHVAPASGFVTSRQWALVQGLRCRGV
jgi:hypothetical protein